MKQPKTRVKTAHIDSAIPIFAAAGTFLLGALALPIYRLWAILLTGGLSIGAYVALKLTKFKGREASLTEEYYTDDKELDAQIKYGFETFERFNAIAKSTGDTKIAGYITRIANATEGIVDDVITDPQDRGDAGTFFSYYLPTIDKLLTLYEQFGKNSFGENAQSGRQRVEGCLEMVAGSFEKFLDKLYRNDADEIKISIEVLKMMLRSDGLASKEDTMGAHKAKDSAQTYTASEIDKQIDDISAALVQTSGAN